MRLFDYLNISGVDVPFVLTNRDKEAGQSTQPVTLCLTVIVSSNLQSTKDTLPDADEAMATIDLSESVTWEGTLEKIKWVMDTLSPVAEVRFNDLYINNP